MVRCGGQEVQAGKSEMIMVVIIPIVVGVPLVRIFIPPAVIMVPAVGARISKFMPPVLGFSTLRAVVLDGLMKLVVRFDGALLAIIRTHNGRACEQNGPC
jgi:hypothetical protein